MIKEKKDAAYKIEKKLSMKDWHSVKNGFIKCYGVFDWLVKELQLVLVNMLPFMFFLLTIIVVSIHDEDYAGMGDLIVAYDLLFYLFLIWFLNRYFKRYFLIIKSIFRQKKVNNE